jgi:hypothetical protein
MENIDIMNDSELDLFARKAFITSMESNSNYVSPVSLMYGVGLETAYDDGFFSRLMRGLGRATAFTNASKVKAALKDIRHLSVDKISDGETSGVSVDRKLLAQALNFGKQFGENSKKSESTINSIVDNIKSILSNSEFKRNLSLYQDKAGGAADIIINNLIKVLEILCINTAFPRLFPKVIILASTYIPFFSFTWGFACFAMWIAAIVIVIRTVFLVIFNYEVSPELKKYITTSFGSINKEINKVFKLLTGVSLDGNVDNEIEKLANKYSDIFEFTDSKTKSISKEEKVQIIQGLIALNDNSDALTAFDTSNLKPLFKAMNMTNKIVSKLDGNSSEIKKEVENTNKIQATMYKLVDSSLKIVLATLNDAKKY